MKHRLLSKKFLSAALVFAALFIFSATPARAQLDETCTITANGQTVNVGYGGEFRIPNIPSGSQLVRVYAICTKDGKTRYGRSSIFFQVRPRQNFVLSELDMVWRDTPFPSTSAIKATPDSSFLSQIGSTTQVRVMVTLSDNTQKDVTARGFGTTYLTSNPDVATVNEQGLVTATGIGTALITANNEGATAVTRLSVAPSNLLTTVEGIVQLENGAAAVGAAVVVPGIGETVVTDPEGKFSFSGIFAPLGSLKARAYNLVNNQLLLGTTGSLRLIQGGITDVGIIVIKPVTNFVYWKDAVSGSWTAAARWSTGVVPTVNDNVFIGVPGNITVTYSQGATTIKSLLCDEDFIISGGDFFSLTDSSEITGNLTLSAGILTGSSAFAIFDEFRWSGGRIEGNGTIDVATSGTMFFSGGLNNVVQRAINNAGTILCNGNIALDNGAIINNLTGAVFNLQIDVLFTGNPTTDFNNAGSFIKSGGLGTTRIINVRFRNTGTINVNAGVLSFDIGGSSTGGAINVSNGAQLDLVGNSGSFIWSGTIGSGAGTIRLFTGTLQIGPGGAIFSFPNGGFLFNSGSMSGSGTVTNNGIFTLTSGDINGLSMLTNNGTFNWSGGSITGPGTLNNTGNFNIASDVGVNFRGGATINNSGTVTWTGTGGGFGIVGGEGAVFNNLAGGIFDIQNNAAFNGDYHGGTRTAFNNAGTVIKSAGTGTSTLEVTFNNTNGTMNVQSGTLALSAGGTTTSGIYTIADTANLNLSAGTFNYPGGTITVTRGVLNLNGFSGTHIFSGNYSGSGAGIIRLSNGTLKIDTTVVATFNFTGGGFQWTGGSITGPGTLNNTGSFSIAGDVGVNFRGGATINNSGTVTWTGTGGGFGIVSGQGAVFNNLAGGIFDIQNNAAFNGDYHGGTRTAFNNAGTVIKSAGTGTSTLDVTFNNTNGTMNVQSGTLALSAGGTSTGGGITVANGTSLNLNDTHVFSGSYSGSVDGTVNLGTLQIAASGATFNFTGGGFKWSNGTITGPGILTNTGSFNIASDVGVNFRGGATINNSGTVTWTGTGGGFGIVGGQGAVFNNLAGGIFDIQNNAAFNGDYHGGTRTAFNNAGTVIKSAGTGTSTLEVTFNNTNGTMNVQSGTLALSAGGTTTSGIYTIADTANLNLSAGTFNYPGGTITVTRGVLNLNGFSGTHIFSGNYSGSGAGIIRLSNGTLKIDTTVVATFNFTGGGFQWTGGSITGPGTLNNTGSFSIAGDVGVNFRGGATINNSGTVTWTGTGGGFGIVSGQGAVFNNLAGGIFDIQNNAAFNGDYHGGTRTAFNNAGTVIKSAGTGTSTLDVTFTNTGTVDIRTGILSFSSGYTQQTASSNIGITISGLNAGTGFGQHRTTAGVTTLDGNLNVSLNNFTPSAGNIFQVMTFVNRNGTQFDNINLPALPAGLIWGPPVYTNTSLTLPVVAGQ